MSDMVEKPRSRVGWGFYLKLVLTVGILGFLSTYVRWNDVLAHVRHADLSWFALAICLSAGSFLLVATRWWLLLRIQQVNLTFPHTLSLALIGQFFSAFLLGANGGDAMRVFYAMRAKPRQKAKVTMTIVVDRAFGMVMMIAWILAALPYEVSRISGDPTLVEKLFLFKMLLAAFAFGVVVLFFTPFQHFPPWCHRLWLKVPKRDIIAGLHSDSKLYLRKWPMTLGSLACACLVHGLTFSASYCLAQGFGINISFSATVIVIALTMIAAGTPLSIGGHGIREATLLPLFTLFQVTNAAHEIIRVTPPTNSLGLAFSLTFYVLFQFSWSAIGGLVYLFYHHQVKKEDGEAEALLEATQ